ncbi:MAG: hypothetical protein WBC74_02910 [Candidatus Omnitrophota bacterium]
MSTIKRVFSRIAAILIILGVSFAACELAVRIVSPQVAGPVQFAYDPKLGAIPVPNQSARRIAPGIYDYTYSNNSCGLRGIKEYGVNKNPAKFRILLLGDSSTYGIGVNDEETFAYKIEEELLREGLKAETINAGNPGKGTDYALRFFQVSGYKFNPDLTALCFSKTDFTDNMRSEYYNVTPDRERQLFAKDLSGSIVAKKRFLKFLPLYNWIITRSHFANLLKQTAIRVILTRAEKNTSVPTSSPLVIHYTVDKDAFPGERSARLTEIFFKHLKKAVYDSGSDLIVFYIPDSEDVIRYRKKESVSKGEEVIGDTVRSRNVKFLSLAPVLAESGKPIELLYYTEGHWTPLGHSIAAGFMSEHIKKYVEEKVES